MDSKLETQLILERVPYSDPAKLKQQKSEYRQQIKDLELPKLFENPQITSTLDRDELALRMEEINAVVGIFDLLQNPEVLKSINTQTKDSGSLDESIVGKIILGISPMKRFLYEHYHLKRDQFDTSEEAIKFYCDLYQNLFETLCQKTHTTTRPIETKQAIINLITPVTTELAAAISLSSIDQPTSLDSRITWATADQDQSGALDFIQATDPPTLVQVKSSRVSTAEKLFPGFDFGHKASQFKIINLVQNPQEPDIISVEFLNGQDSQRLLIDKEKVEATLAAIGLKHPFKIGTTVSTPNPAMKAVCLILINSTSTKWWQ